jgi:hypothetical protein
MRLSKLPLRGILTQLFQAEPFGFCPLALDIKFG